MAIGLMVQAGNRWDTLPLLLISNNNNSGQAGVPGAGDVATILSGKVYVSQTISIEKLVLKGTGMLDLGQDTDCPDG